MPATYRISGMDRGQLDEIVESLRNTGSEVEVLGVPSESRFSPTADEFLVAADDVAALSLLSRAGINFASCVPTKSAIAEYRVGGHTPEALSEKARLAASRGGHIEIVSEEKDRVFGNVTIFDGEKVPEIEFRIRADASGLVTLLADRNTLISRSS